MHAAPGRQGRKRRFAKPVRRRRSQRQLPLQLWQQRGDHQSDLDADAPCRDDRIYRWRTDRVQRHRGIGGRSLVLHSQYGRRLLCAPDAAGDQRRDFDRMASRLQASMEGQRRLLHDVSHELRSPLARLQAAVGILRQKPEQPADMIARIEDETARIDHLVGELLTLSRLEAGDLAGAAEEVDMHELVDEVVRDANFEAQAQGRQVVWEENGTAVLQGRPELLHSAIENIVRNALKHAPDCRTVWVETSADAIRRLYILQVLDAGAGVPTEELPSLFSFPLPSS